MSALRDAAVAVLDAYQHGDDGDGNDLATCIARLSNAVDDEQTSCRHCGALGEDTGGKCPRCERNRDGK